MQHAFQCYIGRPEESSRREVYHFLKKNESATAAFRSSKRCILWAGVLILFVGLSMTLITGSRTYTIALQRG